MRQFFPRLDTLVYRYVRKIVGIVTTSSRNFVFYDTRVKARTIGASRGTFVRMNYTLVTVAARHRWHFCFLLIHRSALPLHVAYYDTLDSTRYFTACVSVHVRFTIGPVCRVHCRRQSRSVSLFHSLPPPPPLDFCSSPSLGCIRLSIENFVRVSFARLSPGRVSLPSRASNFTDERIYNGAP